MYDKMREYLIQAEYATEEEIDLIEKIFGMEEQYLRDILYVRTGYHYFGQWENNDEEDEEEYLENHIY